MINNNCLFKRISTFQGEAVVEDAVMKEANMKLHFFSTI